METQDIVIVGASLAGLMAARELRGKRMLVLDAKPRVGQPLKCGEAVEAYVLRELFGPEIDGAPWVMNRILHHDVRFGASRRRIELAYHELDRPAFETWLAEPVAEHLRMGTRVREIRRVAGGFLVGDIHTRSLILACGASYGLQKSLGLVKREPRLGYAWGGLFRAPLPHDETAFLWEPVVSAKGYAWAFPKGDGLWNVGVCGLDAKALRKEVARFYTSLGGAPDEKGAVTLGGHYPADGIVGKTYGDGVLVAGDAAGMVFAGTGEGIAYALQSGRLAGQTIARGDYSKRGLRPYERAWKEKFGRQLRAGVHFKRMLVYLLETGKLERVMRAVPDEILRDMMVEGKIPLGVLARFAYGRLRACGFSSH